MNRPEWVAGGRPQVVGATLIVTKTPAARVGAAMATGQLRCSGCHGKLRPWGYARRRWVRDRARYLRIRPRRARCTECRRTHVVLPDRMLLRRLDRVEVIGAALTASASGVGVRTISRRLQLPPTTVRGWTRRFAARSRVARGARADGGDGADPPWAFPLAAFSSPPPPPAPADSSTIGVSPGALWRRASRESNGQFLR
jgi:hypothetical protein